MPLPDRAVPGDGGGEDVWAEARRLYERTDTPARDIANSLGGLTTKALYRIASRRGWKRHGWTRRPAAKAGAGALGKAEARHRQGSGRQALIRKLERTVAREIAVIDARVKKYAGDEARDTHGIDHERHAKALATLARTLRELAAIDRAELDRAETLEREAQQPDAGAPGEDDDDAFPRDAEALRETLAQRLEQLSRRRKAR